MSERVSTGIDDLDRIMGGGLFPGKLYVVEGAAGTGKTTLGFHFLCAGVARGEPVVYVSLSDTEDEVRSSLAGHGWPLEGITFLDPTMIYGNEEEARSYTFFHPSEIELDRTLSSVIEVCERVRPTRFVFDSLSDLKLVAGDALRYRRQILSLKHRLAGLGATLLFIDARGGQEQASDVDTIADGIVRLEHLSPEYGGNRRRLRLQKLRGTDFIGGHHDFRIETGGFKLYPRLVNLQLPDERGRSEPLTTGIDEVDTMLGGGLDPGTTTMVLGPSGVGKSSFSTQLVRAALERETPVAAYLFDESVDNFLLRSSRIGFDLRPAMDGGGLLLREVNPAETSPGEFSNGIRQSVEQDGVGLVYIDSLTGYLQSMPGEGFLMLYLHDLFAYLNQRKVLTVVVAANHGFIGEDLQQPIELSFLADVVILLRYFEAYGDVRKAISVIKKRTGGHESTIRELRVHTDGVQVGKKLSEFRGILSGQLEYIGREEPLLEPDE